MNQPIDPPANPQGTPAQCRQCGKWHVPNPKMQNVSCSVFHGGGCCHFSDTEVPAPQPTSVTIAAEGSFTASPESGTVSIGGTSTFSIAPRLCGVCREPIPHSPMESRTAHDDCLRCPECGADFVVWKTSAPAILRCLNCLTRWEGKLAGSTGTPAAEVARG